MSGQAVAIDPAVAVALIAVPQRLAQAFCGLRRALTQRDLGALFCSSGLLLLHHHDFIRFGATGAHEQDQQQLSHAQSLTPHHRDATPPIRHENQGTGRNHSGTP